MTLARALVAGPERSVDARKPRANGSGRDGADHGCGTGGYDVAAEAAVVAAARPAPPGARRGREDERANDRTQPSPDRAGGAPAGDARAAAVGDQAGPALQLQLRRGAPLRASGDRLLLPQLQPELLSQPAGLLVPAEHRVRAVVRVRRRGQPGLRDP